MGLYCVPVHGITGFERRREQSDGTQGLLIKYDADSERVFPTLTDEKTQR